MALGDRLKAAEPYMIGFAVPIMIGMLCIILPVQFAQQGSIGSILAKLDESDKKMDLRVALVEKGADLRTDSIIKKLEDVGKKIETDEKELKTFEERMVSMETDPKRLLERLGIAPEATFTAVSVRNELYVLPRSPETVQYMAAQGYEKRQISPMVSGFLVQPSRAGGTNAGMPTLGTQFPPVPATQSPRN